MLNFLDLYQKMQSNSIALVYKGSVSFELVDSIVQIISQKLDASEQNITTRKKVYGVLVECLQNVCFHTEQNKLSSNNELFDQTIALISIEAENDIYMISTGNYILKSSKAVLNNSLSKLNEMSKSELKELYNQKLKNKTFSEKGGAGIGLIDIARKSDDKILFNFQDINQNFDFFSLQAMVNKEVN